MELREALTQIAEIRSAIATTEPFRGYRALPVGFTGALAVLAAAAQPLLVSDPHTNFAAYLALWFCAAVLSLIVAGSTIIRRDWRDVNAFRREVTRHAVAQFLPCLAAGLLLTIAIARHAVEVAWLLPGLWQIIFSLGVFASCRLMPRATVWIGVGIWRAACGISCFPSANWRLHPGRWVYRLASVKPRPRWCCTGIWSVPMADTPFDGLDRVIHEKARLAILTSLLKTREGIVFNDLKQTCDLTDGNLSRHLTTLQESGLIEIWKGQKGNRPQTLVRLTADGRARFLDYLTLLESIVAGALSTAQSDPSATAKPTTRNPQIGLAPT